MTWYAAADNGYVYVRVGTNGAIQTNPDPSDPQFLWTNRTSGTNQTLYGIAWNGLIFTAVGASGTGVYSFDGVDWYPCSGEGIQTLYDVAALTNIVVAVGENGTIIVSQNGEIFQSIPSGTTEHLRGVTVGDSMYVAVGDNDTIVVGSLTSYDTNVLLYEGFLLNTSVPSLAGSTDSSSGDQSDTLWLNETQVNVDHINGEEGSVEGSEAIGSVRMSLEGFANGGTTASSVNAYHNPVIENMTVAESALHTHIEYITTQSYNQVENEQLLASSLGSTATWYASASLVDSAYFYKFLGANDYATLLDSTNVTDSQGYITEYIESGLTGNIIVIEQEPAGVWAAIGREVIEDLAMNEPLMEALAKFHNEEIEATTYTGAVLDVMTLGVAISEQTSFDDIPTINQILQLWLDEKAVLFTGFTDTSGDTYRGVVMNLRNRAVTEYDTYDFNSLGYWGGTSYGTKPDGVYKLEGADDAGVDIAAHILTAITDFGNSPTSRVERAYLGIRNDGSLTLKVIARQDDDTKVAHLYDMTEVGSTLRRERVKLGKGVRAAYFQFELSNTAGGDFELDEMVLVPIALARRIT